MVHFAVPSGSAAVVEAEAESPLKRAVPVVKGRKRRWKKDGVLAIVVVGAEVARRRAVARARRARLRRFREGDSVCWRENVLVGGMVLEGCCAVFRKMCRLVCFFGLLVLSRKLDDIIRGEGWGSLDMFSQRLIALRIDIPR